MPSFLTRPNGVHYITFTINGRRVWRSLRTTNKKLARERYREEADLFERGLLGLQNKKPIPTLAELFDEYLPFCKGHKAARTYRDAECHIRLFLKPFFGALTAMDLEAKHIEDFTGIMLNRRDPDTGIPAPYHPRTINLRLETLSKILHRAVENKAIPAMPCKIRKLKEPESLPRYADPDHIRDWMGYLDAAPRLRAILSLMTGISDRDLGFIHLNGYDRHNATLRFRRPKTTTDIVVPLTPIAVTILAFLAKDNPGPGLFRAASSRKAFYIASAKAQAAGGKNLTPHMLRHSFATWLLSIGVPIAHVQQVLGHKSSKTTDRYARVMPEHLRASMAKIESPAFDIQALLSLPVKADGRHDGGRWTDEQRLEQAAKMKGNRLGMKSGKYSGKHARQIKSGSKSLAVMKPKANDDP